MHEREQSLDLYSLNITFITSYCNYRFSCKGINPISFGEFMTNLFVDNVD